MRRASTLILVLLLVFSSCLIFNNDMVITANGSTFFVGEGQNFTKIQDAIDNASSGDTIRILDGIYNESIVIDIPLKVIGNGTNSSFLRGFGDSHSIHVKSSNVEISYLSSTIGSNERSFAALGINPGCSNISVSNCFFSNSKYGIHSGDIAGNSVDHLTIDNCSFMENLVGLELTNNQKMYVSYCVFSNNHDYAIHETSSYNSTLFNSYVESSEIGYYSYKSEFHSINDNQFEKNTLAFHFDSCEVVKAVENIVKRNINGIELESSDNINLNNNTIEDNGFPINEEGDHGVFLHSSTNASIANNTFKNCGLKVEGDRKSHWITHDIRDNSVNSGNLNYFIGQSNKTISNTSGQVVLADCHDIKIIRSDLSNASYGLNSMFVWNLSIERCNFDNSHNGIQIEDSERGIKNILITNNSINNTQNYGIRIHSNSGVFESALCYNNSISDTRYGIEYSMDSSVHSTNNNIASNKIQNSSHTGILIRKLSNISIHGNDLSSNFHGITLSGNRDDLVNYTMIFNNSISQGSDGILIDGYSNISINMNVISNMAYYAVKILYSKDSIIVNNTAMNNSRDGISVQRSTFFLISNNTIGTLGLGSFGAGLLLKYSHFNDLNNNTIKMGGSGIYFYHCWNNVLRNNVMTGCGFNVNDLPYGPYSNDIDTTNLVDNKPIIHIIGENNITIPSNVSQIFLRDVDDCYIEGVSFVNTSRAIFAKYCDRLIIKNCSFRGNSGKLNLEYSDRCYFDNLTFDNTTGYIDVYGSDYFRLENSTISLSEGGRIGYYSLYCLYNILKNNTFLNCGIDMNAVGQFYFTTWTIENNTVNGKEILYLLDEKDMIIEEQMGQILLVKCENITIKNQNLSNTATGIFIYDCTEFSIINNTCDNNRWGLYYDQERVDCEKVNIINNSFSNNSHCGMALKTHHYRDFDQAMIRDNICNNNDFVGMTLQYIDDDISIINNTYIGNGVNSIGISGYNKANIAENICILNNTMVNSNAGVTMVNLVNAIVTGNIMTGMSFSPLYSVNVDDIIFTNNKITKNGDHGLEIDECDRVVIENNEIRQNSGNGIIIDGPSDYVSISLNDISQNSGSGIEISKYDEVMIIENSIINNKNNGINLDRSDYPGIGNIIGNLIENCGESGAIINSQRMNISNNRILNSSGFGLWIKEGTGFDIYHNYFQNNSDEFQACDENGNNNWDDGTYGNTWMDWQTPDSNNDGIVDLKYSIDGAGVESDRYPLKMDHPIISGARSIQIYEDEYFSYKYYISNYNGSFNYSFASNRSWLQCDDDLTIFGTPDDPDIGETTASLTVSDGNIFNISINISITVISVNDVPIITTSPKLVAYEEVLYWNVFSAHDPDLVGNIEWSLFVQTADFLVINKSTGNLSGIPQNSHVGKHFATVKAKDDVGSVGTFTFVFEVFNINDLPTIENNISDMILYEDDNLSIDFNVSDIDPGPDICSWEVHSNCTFLSINNETGLLIGDPGVSDIGFFWVNVTVSDNNGGIDWINFTLTVRPENSAPTILTLDNIQIYEGEEYNVTYSASDPDHYDTLSWSMRSDSPFLSFNSTTLTLHGDPDNYDVGAYWVNISVDDGQGGRDWTNFTLTILNINDDPVITTLNTLTSIEDIFYSVDYDAYDIDLSNEILYWSVNTTADFLTLDRNSGLLSGTPDDIDIGVFWVNITVFDGVGGYDWTNFTLTVQNVNDIPMILTDNIITTLEDELYFNDYEVVDDDPASEGDVIWWTLYTNAPFLSIDNLTGNLSGLPLNEHVGLFIVNITVEDGKGGFDFTVFTLSVINVNDAPMITTVPDCNATEDVDYYVQFDVFDIDPSLYIPEWHLNTTCPWLDLSSNTGVLSGTPDNDHVGTWLIRLSVTDGYGGWDSIEFNITVLNVNDPPVLETEFIPDGFEDSEYEFRLNAYDIDPTFDQLIFLIISKSCDPLSLDPDSGSITGFLGNEDVGYHWLHVKINDGNGGDTFVNYSFSVFNVNDDPIIDHFIIPNIYEDLEFNLDLNATDVDPTHDRLIWSIVQTDAGFIEINERTGLISGLPENEDVGIWWVLVRVSDLHGGSSEQNLTLEVINVNDPPVIQIVDLPDAFEDTEYNFGLNGSDIDEGDIISWKLTSSASFLTVDPKSGELSGLPLNEDEGIWWVHINLSDSNGGYASINLSLTVVGINDAPIIQLVNPIFIADEDTAISINLSELFTDVDTDQLTYRFENCENLSLQQIQNALICEPDENWIGSRTIEIVAFDGEFEVNITLTLEYDQVPDNPSDLNINCGLTYREGGDQWVIGSASDPDLVYGDSLTFIWYSNITGKIGEGESVNLSLPPGLHEVTLEVEDSFGLKSSTSVLINILDVEEESTPSSSSNMTIIIIASVGIILLILIGILLFLFLKNRKKEPETEANDSGQLSPVAPVNSVPDPSGVDQDNVNPEPPQISVQENSIPQSMPEPVQESPDHSYDNYNTEGSSAHPPVPEIENIISEPQVEDNPFLSAPYEEIEGNHDPVNNNIEPSTE